MADDISTQEPEIKEPEKQTNRVFTQSDVDKLVAEQVKKAVSDFADYGETKKQLQQMQEEKKKAELEKLDEVERLKAELEEASRYKTELEAVRAEHKKAQIKQSVLNDTKFAGLPRAYKQLIPLSEDENLVKEEAEKALEEFRRDTGATVKDTFGIKQIKTADDIKVSAPSDIANSLRAKLAEKLNSRK